MFFKFIKKGKNTPTSFPDCSFSVAWEEQREELAKSRAVNHSMANLQFDLGPNYSTP
jgi:hypothetical protein